MEFLVRFWSEQQGQDLIECSLLIALLAVLSLALLWDAQPAIEHIWKTNTNNIRAADRAAGG